MHFSKILWPRDRMSEIGPTSRPVSKSIGIESMKSITLSMCKRMTLVRERCSFEIGGAPLRRVWEPRTTGWGAVSGGSTGIKYREERGNSI